MMIKGCLQYFADLINHFLPNLLSDTIFMQNDLFLAREYPHIIYKKKPGQNK